jgi:hypothetical protein
MARDLIDFSAGEWLEEIQPPRRRLQIFAIHVKPGKLTTNVELAVAGNPVDRISLSIHAIADGSRFRRIGGPTS